MNARRFLLKRWDRALVLLSALVVVGVGVGAGTPPIAPPDTTLIDDREKHVRCYDRHQSSNGFIRPTLQIRRPQSVTIVTNPPAGIGLVIAEVARGFMVKRVIVNTPAFRAGVSEGDVIIAIDGRLAAKLELRDAVRHIRGQVGSLVELTLSRSGAEQPWRIKLQREVLPQPPALILDD